MDRYSSTPSKYEVLGFHVLLPLYSMLDPGKPEVSRCWQHYVDNTEVPECMETMFVYVLVSGIKFEYP